jgi:hypothetical protein
MILASGYDQSCSFDADCVAVSEGDACSVCLSACRNAAINASAVTQFYDDFAKISTMTNYNGDIDCGCTERFSACCRGGTCHADAQCQAADAGGD